MQKGPIRIDVERVLMERLGPRGRHIPGFVIRMLERLICQKEMNELLEANYPRRGADFCRGILESLDVRLSVHGIGRMPASSRCIIVSNHPLGGLDGISMISWLSDLYGRQVHFIVNDLLMAIEPLRECFVPVNKHGAQSREAAVALDVVLSGDDPVVIYPAGLVSRLGDDGTISDLVWRKMAVTKAIESRRDIVPVHFEGRNSLSFYRWARLRKRLGIKFNYEMLLLPREVMRSRGKQYTLTVGDVVPWQSLYGGDSAADEASMLRHIVYSLPAKYPESI